MPVSKEKEEGIGGVGGRRSKAHLEIWQTALVAMAKRPFPARARTIDTAVITDDHAMHVARSHFNSMHALQSSDGSRQGVCIPPFNAAPKMGNEDFALVPQCPPSPREDMPAPNCKRMPPTRRDCPMRVIGWWTTVARCALH